MDRYESQENVDSHQYRNIFEDDVRTSNFAAIRQFIHNAIWSVKVHDFKTKKFRAFIATLRRQLHLDRKSTKSGYDRHFDNEQRGWLDSYMKNDLVLSNTSERPHYF